MATIYDPNQGNFAPVSTTSVTDFIHGGQNMGTANGMNYWAVPKADGGYDFYREAGSDIRAISQADAQRELGSTQDATSSASTNYSTPNYSTIANQYAPAFEATLAAKLADLQNQYQQGVDSYNHQYNEALGNLKNNFTNNYNQTDQSYNNAQQGTQRSMAARGLGDSSYLTNALGNLNSSYDNSYKNLTNTYNQSQGDLNYNHDQAMQNYQNQLAQGQNQYAALKADFYNPGSAFTTPDQVSAYVANKMSAASAAAPSVSPVAMTYNNPYINYDANSAYTNTLGTNNTGTVSGQINGTGTANNTNKYIYYGTNQ